MATAQPRGGFHAGGRLQALPFRGGPGTELARGTYTSSPAGGRRASAGLNRTRANHCFAFNAGTCQRGACRFAHVCANCGSASHAAVACTRGAKGKTALPSKELGPHPNSLGTPLTTPALGELGLERERLLAQSRASNTHSSDSTYLQAW